MEKPDEPNFDLNLGRFKTLSDGEKGKILQKKKSTSTNNATRLWINCLREYLVEKECPELEAIETSELPSILSNFYFELRRKNLTKLIQMMAKKKSE